MTASKTTHLSKGNRELTRRVAMAHRVAITQHRAAMAHNRAVIHHRRVATHHHMGYAYPPPQGMQQSSSSTNVVVVGGAPATNTIIVHRHGVNHCMHCLISLFFFPWIFVWIFLCITSK
ncbi:unnamed protein product [Candidula unifasciata]|uniref:Uncharacterized protein n=1 Tax=Candidula unifasciata TaxID=100452 RepID=A0A8S3YN09_9EUPU|nr:unnamed protein product [Candidula unifasciata]